MTSRSDFSVDFEQDPRLVEVTSPSDEITVQDSHDTLTDVQDTEEGGQYPFLVSTTGGEPLGGGVSVGLTTVLNNTQYAFQATSPRTVGAVTNSDPLGEMLEDNLATFQTDGVQRGDYVINFTDQSVTEVLAVISEILLITRGLRNGTANTFTATDSYKIWEVLEAELSGGNFTAVDELGAGINPLFPVFGRFISKASASSSTTANQSQLEHGTFNGEVTVFPGGPNSETGTTYPTGTLQQPSDNMVDARQIALNNGLDTLKFKANMFIAVDLSGGFNLVGSSPLFIITIDPVADVTGTTIENLTVQGELDGLNAILSCTLLDVSKASGLVFQTNLEGRLITGGDIDILQSFSSREGHLSPDIEQDVGNIIVRDFKGSIRLHEITNGDHSIGLSEGRLLIESTCIGGDIHVRGEPYEVVDNSGPLCNVIYEGEGILVRDIHGQVTRSVFVDTEKVDAGNGYQQTPFNTWTAAVDYAEANNLVRLVLLADAVVDRQLKNFVIDGIGVPSLDLSGQIMDNTIVERCQVTGSYTGQMQATESAIVNLSGMAGVFLTVTAAGTLTVAPNSNLLISRVAPAIAAQPWTLSMNSGQPSQAAVHNISGGLIVTNMDDAADVLHVHFAQGELTIDASCTLGSLVITGDVKVNDNSNGTLVIDKSTSKLTTESHTRLGLEKGNAWTDTPTQSGDDSGDIVIDNTGDAETSSTAARQ